MTALVLDFIKEQMKNEGVEKVYKKQKQHGNNICENIKQSKKISSGVLTWNSVSSLDNPEFIAGVQSQIANKVVMNNILKVGLAMKKKGHENEHLYIQKSVKLTCNISELKEILQCLNEWLDFGSGVGKSCNSTLSFF